MKSNDDFSLRIYPRIDAMHFFTTLEMAFNGPRAQPKPEELNSYRSCSSRCSAIKITALIGLISTVAFAVFAVIAFDLLGMTFSLIGATLLGILCYDAFVVAGRMQKVFDSVQVNDGSSGKDFLLHFRNKYTRANYLTEGTLLARPIGQLAFRKCYS